MGIIPARGGSKGIPGKNIKLLNGKPLIGYTVDAAKQSSRLSKVIVSTDDENIARISQELGVEVPFIRPNEISRDDTPTLPVVEHAIKYYEAKGELYDAVCILQPTSPFRENLLIDRAIEKLEKSDYDAIVSVREVPHEYNPHWVFEVDQKGTLKIATGESDIITRRQNLPQAYIRDGALYLTKTEVILKKKSLYGESLGFEVHHPAYYVNLDTMDDWERIEELMS